MRALGLAKGLGTLALVAALGATLGMVADVALVLPTAARWAIWGAWVASAGLALALAVVVPAVRRRRWADLAAVAESGHPDLGERITSAVDLLADHASRAHGSPELIGALAEDAAERSRGIDPAVAVSGRPAAVRLALGVLAILLVLAPSVVRPDPFEPLLMRFVAPWRDLDRIGRFVVDVTPGDKVVAVGSDVPFAATVRPRFGSAEAPKEAWLEWTDESGRSRRSRMASDSDDPAPRRSFNLVLPRVAGSFRYRVTTGPAQSRRHAISAIEPPRVASLSATIEPPKYTKTPTTTVGNPSRIDVWQGSRITLRLAPSKAVRGVVLDWPGEAVEGRRISSSRPGSRWRWPATPAARAGPPRSTPGRPAPTPSGSPTNTA